jgi:O-antigen/teichoic acid export membrane protein
VSGPEGSRSVAWNAVARTGGEVFAKLASVVFFLAVARELGEERFGDLMFALSYTTVMTLPSGFGTEELIARDVARDPELVHDYASNVMAIKVALSVALVLVGEAIVLLLDYSSEVALVVLIVGGAVAIENLGRTWGAVLQAYQRQEVVAVALIVQRVLTAVAGVGVIVLGGGLVAVSLVMLVSAIIGFAVATVAMHRLVVAVRPRIDVARWRPLMMAGIPVGTVAVLLVALVKIDQTLLSFLSDDENREVGFYGAAFRLTEATWFIGWAISAAMLPWFAAHREGPDALASGFELGTKVTAAVLVPIGLTFVLFAEPLIDLFYGSGYEAAVDPLRYLGAMLVFVGINDLAAVLLIARDRPLAFARVIAVVLVVNVAVNFVVIPAYGATGAAAVAAASGFLLFALGFVLIRSIAGRLRLVRPLGAATVAGLAMAGTVLISGLPPVAAGALGLAVYGAVFLGFERLAFPEDLATFRDLARRRRPPEGAAA